MDYQWVGFNDVRHHAQVSMKNPQNSEVRTTFQERTLAFTNCIRTWFRKRKRPRLLMEEVTEVLISFMNLFLTWHLIFLSNWMHPRKKKVNLMSLKGRFYFSQPAPQVCPIKVPLKFDSPVAINLDYFAVPPVSTLVYEKAKARLGNPIHHWFVMPKLLKVLVLRYGLTHI